MSGWGEEAWGQFPWGGGVAGSVDAADISYYVVNYAPAIAVAVDRRGSVTNKPADFRTEVPLPARHDRDVAVAASSAPVLTRAAAYLTTISKAGSP
jgi:hypothetical protein